MSRTVQCTARRGLGERRRSPSIHIGCTGTQRHGCHTHHAQGELVAKGVVPGVLATLFISSVLPAHALEEGVHAIEGATKYVPSPMDGPSWQVYVGATVGVIPFVIATYEFSKRVIIQRRCQVCHGTGLVLKGTSKYYKKCRACGGFLPWLGWRAFFTGSFTGIANGSPVLPPEGQTSVFYKVPDARQVPPEQAPGRQGRSPAAEEDDRDP